MADVYILVVRTVYTYMGTSYMHACRHDLALSDPDRPHRTEYSYYGNRRGMFRHISYYVQSSCDLDT